MHSPDYIWAKVLSHMEGQITPTVVATWFDDAQVVELSEKQIVLYSPSELRREYIKGRYAEYIKYALKELFQMEDMQVIVLSEQEKDEHMSRSFRHKFLENNPQYTFDRFIVGPPNEFAHAAAVAVANNPAEAYNPLFIYGPSGLGKTHLLYAIASAISQKYPDFNIVYIKGDQFTNELIQALKEGKNVEFRSKYRNADLFLVDDVQFIAGKDSTQEEFFHTFNTLYENHKQIVLTSDRPPHEMLRLEDRLRTRFQWGVIADIKPPDYEMRCAIIQNKSRSLGLQIPMEVIGYIADNITNNIRQIEGTVKKIKAYRDLSNMEINVENVKRVIKDMYHGKSDTLPTPDLIIKETARYFNTDAEILRGVQRNKGVAEARHVAMYLVRKMTNLSLPDTGREFNRDHTTVLSAIKKIDSALADAKNPMNDTIRDVMENVNNKLQAH